MEPILTIRDLVKNFGSQPVLRGVTLDVHAGDVVATDRRQRFGQDDALYAVSTCSRISTRGEIRLDGELLGYRNAGGKRLRLPGGSLGEAAFAHRHGVSKLQSVSASDSPPQCHAWPDQGAPAAGQRGPRHCRGVAGPCRSRRPSRLLSLGDLGWTAATGGDRTGSGDASRGCCSWTR